MSKDIEDKLSLLDIAYVLHRRRYLESSLIIDFLSSQHGRVAAVRRGALGPKSRMGGVLQPLIPLHVSFSGRSELLTLRGAESIKRAPSLSARAMYSLFYVNELVLRLTAPRDPNGELFRAYEAVIEGLCRNETLEPLLRKFEKNLLDALGFGLNLETEADSAIPIDPARTYYYVVEHGAVTTPNALTSIKVSGQALRALSGKISFAPEDLREAKLLMRFVIDYHLEGRKLTSRDIFKTAK